MKNCEEWRAGPGPGVARGLRRGAWFSRHDTNVRASTRVSGRARKISAPVLVVAVVWLLCYAGAGGVAEGSEGSWAVERRGAVMEMGYGSGGDYPCYAALHLDSGYLRLVPSRNAGWGTSVVLPPSLWTGGRYHQGAAVTAATRPEGGLLLVELRGEQAGVPFEITLRLYPPQQGELRARVDGRLLGAPALDPRPNEAFKPVMLSSMKVSPLLWDCREALVDGRRYVIPAQGWIAGPPFFLAGEFALAGGTSAWKKNAPTVAVELDTPLTVAGWVTATEDPNADNVALWAASEEPLASWGYRIVTRPAAETSLAYLERVMDRYHEGFDVYTDCDAAGNHFLVRARMGDAPDMDEACRASPHAGSTCIKATFGSRGNNWGGWYFMNGVLRTGQTAPEPNWGDWPDAGVDLTGATALTFWARGQEGGERVEFLAFGVGRDPATGRPTKPYPDSSARLSTGYVTLTRDWRQYTLDLRSADLSYVLGGFGWVTNAVQNGGRDITFFLDDIKYDLPRPEQPRFLVSYAGDAERTLCNTGFLYDNALAALAFLASGDKRRAALIADAVCYAAEHDRYYGDGRLRNAYQGGDLAVPPGWEVNGRRGTVRLPGWYDPGTGRWCEDEHQVSTYAGDVAWAMIALLACHEATGKDRYLRVAERLGEWIEEHCRDTRGAGGYTAGYRGWEPDPAKLNYKSTEHNIDLFVAFRRLYDLTGDGRWLERAAHARRFVDAMWDPEEGKFWTGTQEDGVTPNRDVVPLDVQAWAVLALEDGPALYRKALAYAEEHHKVGGGFDFNQDRDGVWYEGTAHMLLAYRRCGEEGKAQALLDYLKAAQEASGAVAAADRNGLSTGLGWSYFRWPHVGATAWLALAEEGLNPFWLKGPRLAVARTDPADGAGSVPAHPVIRIVFSEAVVAGPAFEGVTLQEASGRVLAVRRALEEGKGNVLVLTPEVPLSPGVTLSVLVPAGALQDLAGNPLAQDYTFSFTTAAARKKGDANGDGVVNVLDVVRTVNIALGRIQPTDEERYAADANGDGVINVLDVVRIVNMALGRV